MSNDKMREEFEGRAESKGYNIAKEAGIYYSLSTDEVWNAWQASRAAMGAGGEVVVTKDESGQIVAVTRQDEEGRILKIISESAKPAPVELPAKHISALIEVVRMPNQEFVADAHNEAVKHLRTLAGAASQSKKGG